MPPLILSPSFNSTGSISAPPNLTISGTMTAASGLRWGTQGAIIDEYADGNQIRMYTNTAGKGGWFYFPAGLTVNNSLYITGNSVLSASTTDVYTTLQNSSTGGRTWHINATSNASGEGGGRLLIKDGTAGTARIAIDSTGNVGIGTTSPNLQLTLTGSLLLHNNYTGIHQNIYYNNGWKYSTNGYGWAISDDGSGKLLFQMAPNNTSGAGATATVTQPLVLTNSGNVGIGTSSPNASLTVSGGPIVQQRATGDNLGLLVGNSSIDNSYIRLSNTTGTVDYGQGNGGAFVNVNNGQYWYVATSNAERLRVDASGNVMIGGVSSTGGGLLSVGYGITARSVGVYTPYLQTYNSNAGTNLKTWRFGGEAGGNLLFETVNDAYSAATERMRITSTGNVGIGTSSPAVRLHVAGNVSGGFARGILENTAASGNTDLLIKSLGSTTYSSLTMAGNYNYIFFNDPAQSTERARITSDSTGNLLFSTGTSATERLRIASSGNVGIGTGSPTALLDVNGSLAISSMANYRSYTFSGNISSNTWYEVANKSNLSSGVWVVLVYMETWGAGGSVYDVMYASVPFYYHNVSCNETSGLSYILPTLYGSGHAINSNAAPSVRIRATPVATNQIYIEVNFGSITLTGLDGITAGKKIFVYFRKIA